MPRSFLLVAALIGCVACYAADDKTIRKVPTQPTSPASGVQMFKEYCAVCHGLDGKGTGPAATALKKTPANLTELTARNNGKFPELRVFSVIQGDADMPSAHGSRDMPVWGTVFSEMSRGSGSEVQMRISNLIAYVKTIQVK